MRTRWSRDYVIHKSSNLPSCLDLFLVVTEIYIIVTGNSSESGKRTERWILINRKRARKPISKLRFRRAAFQKSVTLRDAIRIVYSVYICRNIQRPWWLWSLSLIGAEREQRERYRVDTLVELLKFVSVCRAFSPPVGTPRTAEEERRGINSPLLVSLFADDWPWQCGALWAVRDVPQDEKGRETSPARETPWDS